MDYTYSFLQCKEAKPRERCLMQISFFNLKEKRKTIGFTGFCSPNEKSNFRHHEFYIFFFFNLRKKNPGNAGSLVSKEIKPKKQWIVQNGANHSLFIFFALQKEKERKQWITDIRFFSIRKQNGGKDVLCKFFSSN